MHSIYVALTSPAFGALVNVFALCGLYLAIRSWRDGKRISKATETLHLTASYIEKSLSTNHLGQYPNYLSVVIDLISKAKTEVLIVSIVPAVGAFSAPEIWEKLSTALIQTQQSKLPVTLLTGTPHRRVENSRLQFSDALADWVEWLKRSAPDSPQTHAEKVGAMCERYGFQDSSENAEWLLKTVEAMQLRLLETTYFRTTKIYTDDSMPLLAWIVDGREAIFAFNNSRGTPPGFYTHDKSIIDALVGYSSRLQTLSAQAESH